jgi:hypothetical protein
MLSPSPRNPLAYLYSRKQDEGYNQQAGQHPLAQFPSTPDGNHAALYTLPVARGHGQPNRDLVGFSDKWISMSTSDNRAYPFPELRPSKRALTMICSHIVLLGRDLRVQHGIEDARSVQSYAELDWQLHSHPVAGTARCDCGRSGLSRHVLLGPKRNIRMWPQDGAKRPGEDRKLAIRPHPHGQ